MNPVNCRVYDEIIAQVREKVNEAISTGRYEMPVEEEDRDEEEMGQKEEEEEEEALVPFRNRKETNANAGATKKERKVPSEDDLIQQFRDEFKRAELIVELSCTYQQMVMRAHNQQLNPYE